LTTKSSKLEGSGGVYHSWIAGIKFKINAETWLEARKDSGL
jgi:hypothetical protein